jgi:hypothetical protein
MQQHLRIQNVKPQEPVKTADTPLSVQFLPRGLSVGYYKRF